MPQDWETSLDRSVRHRAGRHHRRGSPLVQVNGRSAAPVIDWLGKRDQAWRESITHAAIDMSATYAKAVRDALPHAQLAVDRYHLVKRANQMIESVRRRTTWEPRGRRGRKADPSGSIGAGCYVVPNG